jgi:Tfp pilus assembly protein PilO
MTANRRERLLIIGTLACLVLLASDRFIVSPLADLWKVRSERIAALDQSIAAGEQLLERESAIRDQWAEMRARSLPADVATAQNDLLNHVNNWSASSRLAVTVLKPRWIREENAGDRIEVRASSSGSLQTISQFLYELEKSPMAVRLEDVQISSNDALGKVLSLDVRFTGLVLPEVK